MRGYQSVTNMKSPLIVALLSTFIVSSAFMANGAIIQLRLSPYPVPAASAFSAAPTAKDSTGQAVAVGGNAPSWSFSAPFHSELTRQFYIDLNPTPAPYAFQAFGIEIPFFRKGFPLSRSTLTVNLDPEDSASLARDLNHTNLTLLTNDGLESDFQKAAVIASWRMKADMNAVSDYDVQAVYKFLEAGVLLSQKAYFTCPPQMVSARNWLVQVISEIPNRVKHAVGLDNANKIVLDFDSIEPNKFGVLWRNIGSTV